MMIGSRMPGARQKPLAELARWAADSGFGAIDIGGPDAQAVEATRHAALEVGTLDLGGTGQLLSPDADARRAGAQAIAEQAKRA